MPTVLSQRAGCWLVGSITLAIVVWLQWPRQHGDPLFDAAVARPRDLSLFEVRR